MIAVAMTTQIASRLSTAMMDLLSACRLGRLGFSGSEIHSKKMKDFGKKAVRRWPP
jgi:hypothetical protein